MADLSLTPYVVRRETDRCLFVPSRTLVGLMTFGFAAVSVFMLYLSTMFFTHAITPVPTNLFGPILLLSSGLLAFWAVRAWRTRHIPLSVENGGRVCYGDKELCASGTVRSVRIVESYGGEVGDCEVTLELADGERVYLPSRYFAGFKSRKQARPFAAKLAEALTVPLTELP